METKKPLKLGLKYGAMKMKKVGLVPDSVRIAGCMSCGNMEHTGCVCHMLGAGKKPRKSKKGGIATQEELEKMTPAQRRKLKREATKLSQVETKQKDEEQYLKALSDPKFDEYFTQMDKNEKYRKDHPEIYKDPNWYAKLTPREKATMERKTKIANKEYFDAMEERNKKIQEKLDKEEEERQKKDKSWLDKAFDFATDKVIDIGSKAIGQFVPGTEGLVKKGFVKLKEKLGEGKAKPKRVLSQKQKEYQEALKMIQDEYKVSFKEALQKYKELKSKIK